MCSIRASAASPGFVSLTVEMGFAGFFGSEPGWGTPCRLDVTNQGPSFSGRLRTSLVVWDPVMERFQRQSREQPLELPAGGHRRLELVLPLEAVGTKLTFSAVAKDGVVEGQTAAALLLASRSDRLLLLGRADPSCLALDALALSERGYVTVAVGSRDLPREPLAWAGVRLVVFAEDLWQEPDPSQLRAITYWLEMGGRLVLTGDRAFSGPRVERRGRGELIHWWPGQPRIWPTSRVDGRRLIASLTHWDSLLAGPLRFGPLRRNGLRRNRLFVMALVYAGILIALAYYRRRYRWLLLFISWTAASVAAWTCGDMDSSERHLAAWAWHEPVEGTARAAARFYLSYQSTPLKEETRLPEAALVEAISPGRLHQGSRGIKPAGFPGRLDERQLVTGWFIYHSDLRVAWDKRVELTSLVAMNRGKHPLRLAYLAVGTRVYSLGDLAPGARHIVHPRAEWLGAGGAGAALAKGLAGLAGGIALPDRQAFAQALTEEFVRVAVEVPVLVGWQELPLLVVGPGRQRRVPMYLFTLVKAFPGTRGERAAFGL